MASFNFFEIAMLLFLKKREGDRKSKSKIRNSYFTMLFFIGTKVKSPSKASQRG